MPALPVCTQFFQHMPDLAALKAHRPETVPSPLPVICLAEIGPTLSDAPSQTKTKTRIEDGSIDNADSMEAR